MFLGIDLGTSNSAVAGLVEHAPRIFKTPEGADVMPSVLYLLAYYGKTKDERRSMVLFLALTCTNSPGLNG